MAALIPLCLGIALFADQLELLGHKWQPAVAPVRWLALYAALLSLAQFMQTALNSVGRPRLTMQLKLFHFLVLVPVLILFVRWGVTAVAIGQCVVAAAETVAALAIVRRYLPDFRLQRLAVDARVVDVENHSPGRTSNYRDRRFTTTTMRHTLTMVGPCT